MFYWLLPVHFFALKSTRVIYSVCEQGMCCLSSLRIANHCCAITDRSSRNAVNTGRVWVFSLHLGNGSLFRRSTYRIDTAVVCLGPGGLDSGLLSFFCLPTEGVIRYLTKETKETLAMYYSPHLAVPCQRDSVLICCSSPKMEYLFHRIRFGLASFQACLL